MIHCLKTQPQYFEAVKQHLKTYEIRYNDRNFKVNDTLILQEWNMDHYTNRRIYAKITHILDDFIGLKEGYVILNIKIISEHK